MCDSHGKYVLTDLHSDGVRGKQSPLTDPARVQGRSLQYITGIVRNQGQKLIAINGMSDHVHVLIHIAGHDRYRHWIETRHGLGRLGSGDQSRLNEFH